MDRQTHRERERRTPHEDKDTQREDSYGKLEAETGVMLLQVKECLGPPEAGRGKEGSSLRAFRVSTSLPIP